MSVTFLWGYDIGLNAMQGADALDGTALAILDGWIDSLQHMLAMAYHIFWSQVGLCGTLPQGRPRCFMPCGITHSHSFAVARALPWGLLRGRLVP